jgi:energy-coupling factor transport system ATP-binding protein
MEVTNWGKKRRTIGGRVMQIYIDNMSYHYQRGTPFEVKAISNLSVNITAGKVHAIVGKTGSGKTTLVHLIAGLLRPTAGKVQIGDDVITATTKKIPFRGKVGVVFQYPEQQLFAETVYKDIAYGPMNQGLRGQALSDRVHRAIELVGLDTTFLDKSPFSLSGGQQRRVALAGVLAMEPKLLILDEPTAGLDRRGTEQLFLLLEKLKQQVTLLIVTHQMDEVARIADRVLVMEQGQLVFIGTPAELFSDRDRLQFYGLALPSITSFIDQLNQHINPPIPTTIFQLPELVTYLEKRQKEGSS